MHILILSCSTGQGHNSAALAIKEAVERRGDTCEFHNALLFLSQIYDRVVCDGHVFIYKRFPKLFGVGYRFEENHPPTIIINQMKLGVKKFAKFFESKNFDAIVCTHSFASLIVNEYKKRSGSKVPLAFVSTDYTCCPGAPESEADLYFAPHPLLRGEFEASGIKPESFFPFGIPVSNKFIEKRDKSEARRELGLPQNRKIVLLGCGSMGCGPIAKLAALLSRRLPDALIVVVCGNNLRLLERLTRLEHDNIIPLPYTKKMALYLAASDVYITKAGGLSTTETILSDVPLLYIDAVPGCETRNIDFMVGNNFAAAAESHTDVINKVIGILNNPQKALDGVKKCRSSLADDPAEAICAQLEKFLASK